MRGQDVREQHPILWRGQVQTSLWDPEAGREGLGENVGGRACEGHEGAKLAQAPRPDAGRRGS